MSYYTVMQTQFTKGPVTTEVVREVKPNTKFGVRAWFDDSYLGVDWFDSEKEARNEARRLVNIRPQISQQ